MLATRTLFQSARSSADEAVGQSSCFESFGSERTFPFRGKIPLRACSRLIFNFHLYSATIAVSTILVQYSLSFDGGKISSFMASLAATKSAAPEIMRALMTCEFTSVSRSFSFMR